MARMALILILAIVLALALAAVLQGAARLAGAVSHSEEDTPMPAGLRKIAYPLLIVLLFMATAGAL